jgi:hypothetical protein
MTDKTISNKTIAILIVIALLVTIISTWVVLLKIDQAQLAQTHRGSDVSTSNGNLAITILPQQADTGKRVSHGQVSLTITPQ